MTDQQARERIREKLKERLQRKRLIQPPFPPRYDEVYFRGLAELENNEMPWRAL